MKPSAQFAGSWDFAAGEVFGFRTFRIVIEGGEPRLRSLFQPHIWTTGVNEARCFRTRPKTESDLTPAQRAELDEATTPVTMPDGVIKAARYSNRNYAIHHLFGTMPDCRGGLVNPECLCGFYAYYGPTIDDNDAEVNFYPNLFNVSGVVRAFGRVILGTRGLRAQRAQIVALCPGIDRVPDPELARHYGVPVYDSRADMLRYHPLTDPADYAPAQPRNDSTPTE